MQALFDIFRQQAVIGVLPGVRFQQQRFQHGLIGRVDAFIQLPEAGAEVLFGRQRTQAAEIQPFVRRQYALRVEAHDVIVVMLFFIARHHIPQNTFAGKAHRGTVKLIQQQDMLGGAAVFAAQAAAFVMTEAVFVDQEEADLDAQRCRPALQQATFTLQQLTLFSVKPGLVANPDIQVRRTALADGRCAAHRVKAGDRQLAFRRLLGQHATVELELIKIVTLGFIRRVEANATGNVTVKVTRHQRMMIM